MGTFRLTLKTDSQNMERIGEIRARLQDFTIPFNRILEEWAAGNVLKFNSGKDAEMWGAGSKDLSPAEWSPVTEKYYQQKHGPIKRGNRELFADWLMVRTGALRDALCSRGGFVEYIAAHTLMWGTPNNPEEAIKAIGNRETRPTVYLSKPDRNMIERNLQQYLSLGADYKNIMLATAARQYWLKKEAKQMDINFAAGV